MLEEKDILKIKSVIDESIKANNVVFKEELKTEMATQIGTLRKEVKDDTASQVGTLEKGLSHQLKSIKSDIRKIRKDQDMIVGFFDEERVNIRKRMNRVEEMLHIDSPTETVS